MRAICVAVTLVAAVAAAMPAPPTGEVARLSGVWTGNWGSESGAFDPTHTLDLSFNAFGAGALSVQHSDDLAFVQCRDNAPPSAGAALPNGGLMTCSVARGNGLKQAFVGVLDAAGNTFSGTYVHFNVPGGATTSMVLTRVQPAPAPVPPPQPPVSQYAFACETAPLVLSCAGDAARPHARIRVTDAFYGRSETTACPSNAMSNTHCSLPGALRVVQALCDGKRECSFDATNTQFGADPCYLTSKYARVTYTCV